MKTDFLIAGGGPAGSAAGIYLADKGADVCLADRSKFPRQKTCGGLLTSKTLRLMENSAIGELDYSLVLNRLNRVSLKNRGKAIAEADCQNSFYLVDRYSFDNSLIERFVQKGGMLVEGNAVVSVDSKNRCALLADGSRLEYKYLVGADGCSGVVQKYVSRKPLERAFGIEAEIPSHYVDTSSILLETGYFKDGYLWHFPKGAYATVGIAFTYDKNFDYAGFLRQHLNELGVKEAVRLKGAFLPYGMGSRVIDNSQDILLVGDAAGFVDAVTGEGTYYALLSGLMAGESLMSDNPIAAYRQRTRSICSSVEKSCRLVSRFYANREFIINKMQGKGRFMSWFCDVQVSENRYDFSLPLISAAYMKYKLMGK